MQKRAFAILFLAGLLAMVFGVQAAPARQENSFFIGVSNSFVGSEWRTQMIQNIQDAAAELTEAGVNIELIIESEDTDAQGQTQQIQNLINSGVDAIIINPGDQTALNLVLEDAVAQGIVVIAVDQEIAAQGVFNVVIDQTEWARISARWLAEELGGEGRIALIEGFVGHPANEARMAGALEVFESYPGIEIAARESGMWDQATGQQVASDILASVPDLDGIWTQDGMATGVLTAIQAAGLENPPLTTGEARASYLQLWNEVSQADPDFTSIGVVNPPGVGADGLRVAVEILLGGTVDESQLAGPFGNTLYVPIPYAVTSENFAEYYAEVADLAPSFTMDGVITQAQAGAFMVGGMSMVPGAMDAEPAATEEAAVSQRLLDIQAAGGGDFVIGVSNSFVGSEWRTQMIQNIQDAAAELTEAGVNIELIIESEDTDAQGQTQQIQNLINSGVDAIIINPGDQTALNLVLEDAVAQGIVVIAVDQEIAAQGVFNVVIDQTEWARISARWLAEELGGEGRIALIEGFVGHPANEARMAGALEVFESYPGIEIAARESGMWDQATGQQVASDILASVPDLDGIWTQDGMATGVLTAIQAAGLENPPLTTGEARASYLQLWNEVSQADPDFTSIGVVNPPGVGADGLRVAVEILLGGTVDESQLAGPFGNTLYVPIPYAVTSENFAEYYAEVADLAPSFTMDGVITQDQAHAFMAQ
jgi:ribose transport system substrate-binding protein